jgi:hypothetical protein
VFAECVVLRCVVTFWLLARLQYAFCALLIVGGKELCSYFTVNCPVAYPAIFCRGGGLTNSAVDRGQREPGSEGSSPLVRCSTQFANELKPVSSKTVNITV